MDNLSGQVIKGYELRELIGEGGFGAVYLAYQRLIGREVAVKIILPQYANQPDFIRRFESEAQLIARLEHPHIVPLYDYWREPNGAYLVMRLVRGGSLADSLDNEGAWSLDRTTAMLNQIASALAIAHRQNIVHRDIKPENILLDENGNAYLSDFGIAKDLGGRQNITQNNAMVGSPAYISPEQIRGESVTPKADIYMLGMMLYEMLTGAHPFKGTTAAALLYKHLSEMPPEIHSVRADIPPIIHEILARALAKNPEERYDDVLDMAAEFRRAARGDRGGDPHATVVIPSETLDLPEPENPYKGLRAFQQADAADFFGREALVETLLGRLRDDGKFARFLAVVGPSGSGKSSAVKAGLLTALQRGGLPGSESWFIVEMVPGIDPMEELEAALLRIAVNPPDSLLAQLNEDERGFVRAVKRVLPGDENTELVVLIDQFEELFTLVEDEPVRQRFLDSIAAAVSDPRGRVRVIITLRADFYDRPLAYARFGELMQQRTEIVLPLSPEEIERAVVSPAERYMLTLERGLVTAIVSDVQNQPGALPLLQYALTELFERRMGRALTLAAYHDIGGTMGALARRADELYENLDEDGEEAVRQMFLRLVTLGEGTEDTRRRVMQAELLSIGSAEVMRDVIDAFGRYRLLTFDHDPATRGSTVEVAHEALIRQWTRLRGWLNNSREDLRLQRRLASAADEWVQSGREKSFLARGARLDQIAELAGNTRLQLNQLERDYVAASLAERQAVRDAERARVEREAALERASRDRLRALVGVLAVATVIAALLTVFAFTQSQAAQSARDAAETEQVAAQEARDLAERQRLAAQEARDLAEQERSRAESLADETRALALAANARSALIEDDTMLALALAIEASAAYQPAPVEVTRVLANAAYSPGIKYRLTDHATSVTATALNADATRGVSVGTDGSMRLYDLASGETLWEVTTDRLFTSVAFSLDGAAILTGEAGLAVGTPDDAEEGARGAVRLWDAETGAPLRTFGEAGGPAHTDSVTSVALSDDGATAVSGSLDRTLIVWDVASGEAIRQIGLGAVMTSTPDGTVTDQVGVVLDIDITPDARYAVTGHGDETVADTAEDFTDRRVRVWDLTTGDLLARFEPRSGFVRAVAINRDGSRVLSGAWDSTNAGFLSLWNVRDGAEVRRIYADTDIIASVDFGPNDAVAISGGWSLRVQVFDLNTGVEIARFQGFPDRVLSIAYSRDGQYALVGSGNIGGNDINRDRDSARDTSVWLIDLRNRAQMGAYLGHGDWVWAIDLSEDGARLATGAGSLRGTPADSSVRVWDAASGEQLLKLDGHTGTVDGVAFTPDGATLLSGAWDRTLLAWDAATGEQLRAFVNPDGDGETAHGDRITSVAVSPDGALALSTAANGEVHLWDVASGALVRAFVGHTGEVSSASFSPDGALAATGAADNRILIWDVATGEIVREITGHTGQVNNAVFSPDGRLLASTSWDGTVNIWNAETGQPLHVLTGHSGATFAVDFSPDGTLLMTAGRDTALRLWDVASGEELRRFDGHTNWVQMLEFSPDGDFVVSGAQDNTARRWRIDLTPNDLLRFVEGQRYRRPLDCGERAQFRLALPPECES